MRTGALLLCAVLCCTLLCRGVVWCAGPWVVWVLAIGGERLKLEMGAWCCPTWALSPGLDFPAASGGVTTPPTGSQLSVSGALGWALHALHVQAVLISPSKLSS